MKTKTCTNRLQAGLGKHIVPTIVVALLLGGCGNREEAPAPAVRPVRTVVVEKRLQEDAAIVTGHVRARNEVSQAFRLHGKLIERGVEVGDRVEAGQLVGRLDSDMERSALDGAEADVRAAQATLDEAELSETRNRNLLAAKAVPQSDYDRALRQLKTARAQLESANARLKSAEDKLSYTELRAEAGGIVTQTGAEAGEVVQAGQMVVKIAQETGRDAIFDIPAWVIRAGLATNHEIHVVLSDNESIGTRGRVREISPQADRVTRNYEVKAELIDPPEGMFLGATVTGGIAQESQQLVEIPSTSLTLMKDKPAVWIYNESKSCVQRREVDIERYTPRTALVRDGLEPGERIVTAGVQELHEGQTVRLLGGAS